MKHLLLIAVLFLPGCMTDRVFFEATKATWEAVSPEYVEYVQKDESLDQDEKNMRIRTVDLFNKTLAEKEKGLE
jgi:hypothetical protein